MYRLSDILPVLISRVGFRQPTRADYAGVYSSENIESKSGRYFDDFHGAVSVENLHEVVLSDPDVSVKDYNTQIVDLKKGVIASVLDAVLGKVDMLEQALEFTTDDHPPVLIPNSGKFVGRQIKVASDPAKSAVIRAISLYFNGAATFDLYLFNSRKKAPIKTLSVATEADNLVVVELADWTLNYMDSAIKSGVFYLGYFQDDLGAVRAYDEQPCRWNCGKIYGSTCIEAARKANELDFDRFQPHISSRTYGLNIEYTAGYDFTERIKQNPALFDTAIGLQMAAVVIERMMFSLRSNLIQRMGAERVQQLYTDLNAESATELIPVSTGLKKQLRREIERLQLTFSPKRKPISTPIEPPCSI